MADQTKTTNLWAPRGIQDTRKIYADGADTHDTDVTAMAYGTDISPEMLAHAKAKMNRDAPLYRKVWLGEPNNFQFRTGIYDVIVLRRL